MRSVDFPEPEGPIRPSASLDATRRLMSLRIWTRAAPEPSERLTLVMEMLSGARPDIGEGLMRLSIVIVPAFPKFATQCCEFVSELRKAKGTIKFINSSGPILTFASRCDWHICK